MPRHLFFLMFLCLPFGSIHAADLPLRHHASPSPDGTKLAYHARPSSGTYGVYVLDIGSGEETRLAGGDGMIAQEPRWSPDGSLIAFVAGLHYQDGGLQLHVIRPDGTGLKQLTAIEDGKGKGPSWSPDSTEIAFGVRKDGPGTSAIHIISPDGAGLRQLTDPEQGLKQPEWSPDGRRFLARRDSTGDRAQSDLVILELAAPDRVAALTSTPQNETMPVWSPDGQFVAFARDADAKNGQYDIYLMRLDDRQEWQLTDTTTLSEFFPIFAPDGRSIYHGQFSQSVHGYQSAIRQLALPATND